jgi:hypothetical protein
MLKTSDMLTQYLGFTNDYTDANKTTGKLWMNQYYLEALAECKNYIAEKTQYGYTKAGQRSIIFSSDVVTLRTIRVKSGDTWYPVTEEPSTLRWQERTMINRQGSIIEKFHIFNEQGVKYFELDPIPVETSATRNIELVVMATQDPLTFPDDVSGGNIDVQQGSALVTGNGTDFSSDYEGRFIQITGGKRWYEIKSVESATNLTLVNSYSETSRNAQSYTIAEMQRTPEQFHFTPIWGAANDYWMRPDPKTAVSFEGRYQVDIAKMKRDYQNKTDGAILPGIPVDGDYGRGTAFENRFLGRHATASPL